MRIPTSTLRRSRMIGALLCLAIAASAQFRLPVIPPFRPFYPYINPAANHFVYQVGDSLRLAALDGSTPSGLTYAHDLGTIDTENGTDHFIRELLADPTNQLVVEMVHEEFLGGVEAFAGDDLHVRLMSTGREVGYVDKYTFEVLHEAIRPSTALQDFLARSIAEGWLVPSDIPNFDYRLETEAFLPTPYYRWNTDGTFSVTFHFGVYAKWYGSSEFFAGSEDFTGTWSISEKGFILIDWEGGRTPATYPARFNFSPSTIGNLVQFESLPVYFTGTFLGWNFTIPRRADRCEGVFPRVYTR